MTVRSIFIDFGVIARTGTGHRQQQAERLG
jgi:hypothetical protein